MRAGTVMLTALKEYLQYLQEVVCQDTQGVHDVLTVQSSCM